MPRSYQVSPADPFTPDAGETDARQTEGGIHPVSQASGTQDRSNHRERQHHPDTDPTFPKERSLPTYPSGSPSHQPGAGDGIALEAIPHTSGGRPFE